MIIFTTFIVTLNILITSGCQLVPHRTHNCPSSFPFEYNLQTIFLDLDGNSDIDLKTCLLKNINSRHSLIIISGYYTYTNPLLFKHKVTESPNVVILTKYVTTSVLELPSIKRVLKSHRSLVYITITDNERFKCADGVLNTTDFLLLETFMNQLWHIHKVRRVAVAFPFSCSEKIIVYSGKRKTDKLLYDRTIKLIDLSNNTFHDIARSGNSLAVDYPLNANIFDRYPTSMTECKNLHYYTKLDLNLTEGYCGLDALVMNEIVKHFKFNLHFIKDEDCLNYGYVSSNNISGSLGCVVRQKLDISFNSRFMTMYSKDYVYFLHYVTTGSLCALVIRAEEIPIWLYVISAYRLELWFFIISLIVSIGLLKWAITKIRSNMTGIGTETFYFYIEEAFTSMMFGFSLKSKRKLYLLRGICLCSSILFAAIYQGHINYLFTTLLRYEPIRTLEALYNSDKVLYMTPAITELMKQLHNPEDTQQQDFLMRSHTISESYTYAFLITNPRAVLLGRKTDAIIEILSEYTDEDRTPIISIVDQCFYTYYVSFITRSGFPFYEEMQRFMQRVGEAGLPIIYHKWTCDMLGVPHSLPKVHREPRPFKKIKLHHQRIAFGILIFGYVVSLIVFTVEIFRSRRCIRLRTPK